MCDVIKKMRSKMPDAFFGLFVFLTAIVAITTYQRGITIETDLFFSLGVI